MKRKIFNKILFLLILLFMFVVMLTFALHLNEKIYTVINLIDNDLQNIEDISLINLIAFPEKFNKKLIRVIGICEIEFEGNGLYFSESDYDQTITKNAVWLDIDEKLPSMTYEDLKKMNGKYVIIEGVFDAKDKGHFDMYSGSIKEINRLELID